MIKKNVLLFLLVVVLAAFAFGDDVEGQIFAEYYAVANHHDGEDGIQGQHGFWLKRVYFGYNSELGNGWSARVRLEMMSPAFSEGTLDAHVKNLHLKKKLNENVSLIVGIIDSPAMDRTEKFYAYRFIEKTPPDLFKFASTRDFGIGLDGKAKGGLVYTLMFGNYSGIKSEDNKGKAIYGRLGWENKNAYAEVNSHYATDDGKKITFLSLFGGIRGGLGRVSLGYYLLNVKPGVGDSKNTGIISAFGAFNIGKKAELFARYDHLTDLNFWDVKDYLPIPCKQYESRFIMTGFNLKVHKMIQVSPNMKYVFYHGDGAPKGDLYFNLSAVVYFSTGIGSPVK